ncbi:MAG: tetratricopeptide repeat protein [Bacteroidota bacterium]
MQKFALTLILTLMLGPLDGKGKGRKGNSEYEQKRYEEAAKLYREGLEMQDGPGRTTSGLFNNLAASLNRQEQYEEAGELFTRAIANAQDPVDRSRASYNAGNNAFQAGDPEAALDYYKQALLADSNNELARYNYEFVRRFMQDQQQNGGGGDQQQQQSGEDDQQQQDQNQDQQEGEDEQQNQDSQQDDDSGEPDPSEEQPEPDPSQLSREQAERILQALQTDERELLKETRKMPGKARRVQKDW